MKKSLNLIGYFTTEFAVHWIFCRFLSLDLSFFWGTMVFWGFHAGRPEAFVARRGAATQKNRKKRKKTEKKESDRVSSAGFCFPLMIPRPNFYPAATHTSLTEFYRVLPSFAEFCRVDLLA